MSSRWRQTSPKELAGWLADATVPWGIAGGWALDLRLGEVTRQHSDIEMSCFLADLPVQLLYKCKQPRDKDLIDLQRCVTVLDAAARLWLRSAAAHPEFLPTLLDIEAPRARNDGIPCERWTTRPSR